MGLTVLSSETASNTVTEIVVIHVNVWLAGGTHFTEVLFRSPLLFSLTLGFAVITST